MGKGKSLEIYFMFKNDNSSSLGDHQHPCITNKLEIHGKASTSTSVFGELGNSDQPPAHDN